ncbi:intermembrane phospholipid transport protein YdbH family protein [Propionivibrio limicola]|uniref:intermembrane phospholipid transport protein YdbH family protein n=1 Tax=Propionivibrio limicola TaxID=167645 RepID=UPI001291C4B9|nr:YdbH domain-containing protein [Propionivibrio limicola]
MRPFPSKRALLCLVAVLLALFVFWLTLPKVLGLAAERWLAIPGLESLHLDIDEIGTGQARLREVRAVYRSAGGHRFRASMHDIALDYSLTERRVQRLNVARAELEVKPEMAAAPSPWPHLAWPRLPANEVRIGDLHVAVLNTKLARLEARGTFEMRQTAERLSAEFRTQGGLARLTAGPAEVSPETLEVLAEWQPLEGTPANATLRIGRDPAQQPASLSGQFSLATATGLGKHLGLDLPLEMADGVMTMQVEATLGEAAGTLRALSGNAEVTKAQGRSTQASVPLEFALSGKLRFFWQAASARIELQPGWQWRIDAGGKHALQTSGRLERVFGLHQAAGNLFSEDAFPFVLRSPSWGRWEGALQHILLKREEGTDGANWREAELQLRLKGGIRQWQHAAFQIRDAQAAGNVALHWSRPEGIRGRIALQAGAERLARSGDSPVSVGRTTWKVEATAKAGNDVPKTLELSGEASAPQVKIEFGAGQTVTLGPSRLQLSRFRPAGSKGVPSVENAEGEVLLATDAVRFRTWPTPMVRARLRFDGGSLHGDGALYLQGTETLRFSGSHALSRGCGEAMFSAQQSLATLGKLLQPRPPALLPLDLRTGEAESRFAVDWCSRPATRINAKGTFQMRNAALGWDRARLEGVQGTVQLDGLHPLRGRISFAAQGGELATGTPLAELNVDLALGAQALTVHALHAGLLGGSVRGGPLTLRWPLADQPLPLEIRSIDLGQLLALPNVQGLSGSGQLNGILPLVYHAGGVEIRDGRLSSVGAGTLKYAPTLTLPENPGLLALRNFHFRHLDVGVLYAADGAYQMQTALEGNNPDFYSGYPIRFRLNINGKLPGLFRAALFSGDFNRHILEQLQSGKLN